MTELISKRFQPDNSTSDVLMAYGMRSDETLAISKYGLVASQHGPLLPAITDCLFFSNFPECFQKFSQVLMTQFLASGLETLRLKQLWFRGCINAYRTIAKEAMPFRAVCKTATWRVKPTLQFVKALERADLLFRVGIVTLESSSPQSHLQNAITDLFVAKQTADRLCAQANAEVLEACPFLASP